MSIAVLDLAVGDRRPFLGRPTTAKKRAYPVYLIKKVTQSTVAVNVAYRAQSILECLIAISQQLKIALWVESRYAAVTTVENKLSTQVHKYTNV